LPAGADALPKPAVVTTSTSMVSSPRLLKIFLAMTSSMIDDTFFPQVTIGSFAFLFYVSEQNSWRLMTFSVDSCAFSAAKSYLERAC